MNHFQNKHQLIHNLVASALTEKMVQKVIINSEQMLGGGCINHASKIKTNVGNFFLKWNSNCASDIFLREAEGLKELKKAADKYLFVPIVFASKLVDSTPGFLVILVLKLKII